jgi:hypothetical protein
MWLTEMSGEASGLIFLLEVRPATVANAVLLTGTDSSTDDGPVHFIDLSGNGM